MLNVLAIVLTVLSISFPNVESSTKPAGYVSDFAHILSPEQVVQLETQLSKLKDETTVEIAVVTVQSLDGRSVEDYTRSLATEWGVGVKGKDNGIMFLIAPNERKARIEVADGIRPKVSDSDSNNIMQNTIIPLFKQKRMGDGVVSGVDALEKLARRDLAQEAATSKQNAKIAGIVIGSIVGGVILVVSAFIIVGGYYNRKSMRAAIIDLQKKARSQLAELEALVKHMDVQASRKTAVAQKRKQFETEYSVNTQSMGTDDLMSLVKALSSLTDNTLPELQDEAEDDKAQAKKARKEGPMILSSLPELIAALEQELQGKDVPPIRKEKLPELKTKLASIKGSAPQSAQADWKVTYQEAADLREEIRKLREQVRKDKEVYDEAVKNGPELLAKLKTRLEELEAKGVSESRLKEARRAYDEAHAMRSSDDSLVQWVLIYYLLSQGQSDANAAERAHSQAHSSSYSSHHDSSSSSSSSSFGGFGGGGGFSGGGSTGSW